MSVKRAILFSVSMIALGAIAMPAAAQDSPAPAPSSTTQDDAEIVVSGIRASLESAQGRKKEATAVTDSIVAEDIGKLPDNTVSDALQRVTGIQVQRGGGEAGTVLIRGLPNIQSYINGRETFTGTFRGVALQDIPAELVAGVDVFKTTTPEQIEGGIAGLIDIRLRRPFDFSGTQVAGGIRALYSDQADKWSYIGSALLSGHWTSANGQEFGILVGASYNKRRYEDQTAFNFGWGPSPVINPATGNPIQVPQTVGAIYNVGDRSRPAANVSVQWKPSPDVEFYADGLFTGYRENFDVNFFIGIPQFIQFGAGGSFTATAQPGSDYAATATGRVNTTLTSKQAFQRKTDGYQADFGTRLTFGNLLVSGEVTYNDSTVKSTQYVVDTGFDAPQVDYQFNVNGTPHIDMNGTDLTNKSLLNLFTLFDNRNLDVSRQWAGRTDLRYEFDGGFLRDIKIGARYARRTGESGGTNTSGINLCCRPAETTIPGFVTLSPGGIIDGRVGIDRFVLGDSDAIRANIDQLRNLAGRPSGPPDFDPTRVFNLSEKVAAFYAQASFASEGSFPIEGIIGVRAVNTATDLDAIQVTFGGGSAPILTPIDTHRSEWDILPSLTLKARPTSNTIVRFVAGKSITRPEFAQLNPATSLSQLGPTGGGTGSGGNANLRSIKSNNLDATFEWYFANTGSFSLSAFYRDLKGYVQTYAANEQIVDSTTLPQTYLVSRPRNTGKGSLKGLEFAYQQFFDFLPGPLAGFGAQANFTYSLGSVEAAPTGTGPATMQDITGVSKYSYNLVAIYEKYGFSARLAYNWRSKFTDSYSTAVPGGRIVVQPLKFLDFSANYALTDKITLTFDATNLLDETYRDDFGTSGFTPRDTRKYDRTFAGGVRIRF